VALLAPVNYGKSASGFTQVDSSNNTSLFWTRYGFVPWAYKAQGWVLPYSLHDLFRLSSCEENAVPATRQNRTGWRQDTTPTPSKVDSSGRHEKEADG